MLAQQIDWEAIMPALRPFYKPRGRYAKPMRLLVGLHLLKPRENLSEEAVVQGWHASLECLPAANRLFSAMAP